MIFNKDEVLKFLPQNIKKQSNFEIGTFYSHHIKAMELTKGRPNSNDGRPEIEVRNGH